MYDYFTGKPTDLDASSGRLTLEVAGVGYDMILGDSLLFSAGKLSLTNGTLLWTDSLSEEGASKLLKLYAHFHSSEHKTVLYGFVTKFKRETFRLLIRASGIGPQSALNMVLFETPQTILTLLSMKNKSGLAKFKGLGERTAAKLVLELAKPAEKLLQEQGEPLSNEDSSESTISGTLKFSLEKELRASLESLGYKESEIAFVLSEFQRSEETLPETIEEAIRLALSMMSQT